MAVVELRYVTLWLRALRFYCVCDMETKPNKTKPYGGGMPIYIYGGGMPIYLYGGGMPICNINSGGMPTHI